MKNGTLGTVEAVADGRMAVRLDGVERRQVVFDVKDYADIDHGYASTIHRAQGVTVDRAHVLATPGLDRHGAYVALTRHRDGVALYYGADDFKDGQALGCTLSRERSKDTTLDYHGQTYGESFAERRGITPQSQIHVPLSTRADVVLTREAPAAQPRGMFDGLKLRSRPALQQEALDGLRPAALERAPAMAPSVVSDLGSAVVRYARAWSDAERMRGQDLPVLEHQKAALQESGQALEAARPGAVRDFAAAIEHQGVIRQALSEPLGPDRTRQLVAGLERGGRGSRRSGASGRAAGEDLAGSGGRAWPVVGVRARRGPGQGGGAHESPGGRAEAGPAA